MRSILRHISPFAPLAVLYLLFHAVLKLVELGMEHHWEILPQALTFNLIIASWVLMILVGLCLFIKRFSPKAAGILYGFCIGLLILLEGGLSIYAHHNGFLLGGELVTRPLSESMGSTIATVGFLLPLLAILLVIGGCILLAFLGFRMKISLRWGWSFSLPLVLSLLGIIFPMEHLKDPLNNRLILHKSLYCIQKSIDYLREEQSNSVQGIVKEVEYNEGLINRLLESNPNWIPLNKQFPLEREDNTEDILSPFFAESKTLPNVVVVIVESLGDEFMGSGLMPFVDSLSQSGLYWKNCLSTTPRSYGAIPAITGSVGGPKSFQFGNMPNHNSMFSILKNAGYKTNAFYAGYFTFDCIYEYLTAQKIDYLSPYYEDYKQHEDKSSGNWWGYHDKVMLQKTASYLRKSSPSVPSCNLIVTLTMHEDLNLEEKEEQNRLMNNTKQISQKAGYPTARCAAARYTDEGLREFFKEYKKSPQFKSTIFVITGDHASGLKNKNSINLHHVPLILWSPLITESKEFSHIVTHNDIAPSLCKLLSSRYGMKMPSTVHWLGSGLGTMKKNMLIVAYSREINEFIWRNYDYISGNDYEEENLFRIDNNFNLIPVKDTQLLNQCRKDFEAMKYLYEYTYYNNKLTQHPIFCSQSVHQRDFRPKNFLVTTPQHKPSQGGGNYYELMGSTTLGNTQGFSIASITLEADVTILADLHIDHYADLAFVFNNGNNLWAGDKVPKFLSVEKPQVGKTYHLSITKEFALNPKGNNSLVIYVATTEKDDRWDPGDQLDFRNIHISIDYKK